MSADFVHLHVHTRYSLLDGTCRIEALMDAVIRDDMRAVAITDHGVMYGVVDFYQKAHKRGIKPILGCEVYVAPGDREEERTEKRRVSPYHLILLAENDLGYRNLVQIVTDAHLNGFYYKPRTTKKILSRFHKGLIGLSACRRGEVAANILNDDVPAAVVAATQYADILGDNNFFLEIQDHGTDEDSKVNAGMFEVADQTGLRVVATNDVHYLKREHSEAHDVLLCMQTQKSLDDPSRLRMQGSDYHLRTSADMAELFGQHKEALETSVEIAGRCDVELKFGELHFPAFDVPDDQTPGKQLLSLCEAGLRDHYGVEDAGNPRDDREQRIVTRFKHELHVIEKTGFINYFLVVWDFVHFARTQGIPVGLRGSGAASLVAYLIGITDIDPLRHSLVFERFLNPERVSPPDFDIDFCHDRRHEVIDYIRDKYGRDRVAQIITFGSLGAKQVIRDVGRVLGISYAECDRLARLVPDDLKITLERALKKSRELAREAETNEACQRILKYATVLEGLYRNPGTHAAGIVIGEQPLVNIIPLARDREGEVVTQYAMEPLSQIGLLKMDVLGLRTLTVIRESLDNIRTATGKSIDANGIPDDDKATYELFNRGDTVGVFQLESGGMRELIRRVGIDRIEDLIAMIALFRPGPMNMLDDYVNRKTGSEEIKYDHPLLEPILAETYGVTVYQEQVQQAASVLSGYSLGQSDLLRRAMSKKDPRIMERQRIRFVDGCKKTNHITGKLATKIFDTLAEFAGYGFNKSHSTAYAVVSYRTAYLKANYPAEFMAALLSSEMGNAEKLQALIEEARRMGLRILPADINESTTRFLPRKDEIRFGLTGIKHVGSAAAEAIVAERDQNGPYHGLLDLCSRIDHHVVNRKVIESMVRCGCFDALHLHRARLYDGIGMAISRAVESARDEASGQTTLFDMMDEGPLKDADKLPDCEQWHESELLAAERELLGFYISGHPLAGHAPLLRRYGLDDITGLSEQPDKARAQLGGIVSRVDLKRTKKGQKMAVIEVEGLNGTVEAVAFPDVYAKNADLFRTNSTVLICGEIENKERVRVLIADICDLAHAPRHLAERVSVHAATSHLDNTELEQIKIILKEHPGPVPVVICLEFPGGEKVFVDTAESFEVTPTEDLILKLERLLGEESVYVQVKQGAELPIS